MSLSEESSERRPTRAFGLKRVLRSSLLVALGVGGYTAYQLGPGYLLLSDRQAAALRRQAGVFFVDVLLILYPLALVASLLGAVVLIGVLIRTRASSRKRWQPRLLLLCVSTLMSLAALEAGAALWRAKLHESPDLRAADLPRGSVRDGESVASPRSDDPKLPALSGRPHEGSPGRVAPIRILVIGESSARGEPYHPWLSVAQIAAWRLEKIVAGRLRPGRHVGRRRGDPRDDAQKARRIELSS